MNILPSLANVSTTTLSQFLRIINHICSLYLTAMINILTLNFFHFHIHIFKILSGQTYPLLWFCWRVTFSVTWLPTGYRTIQRTVRQHRQSVRTLLQLLYDIFYQVNKKIRVVFWQEFFSHLKQGVNHTTHSLTHQS